MNSTTNPNSGGTGVNPFVPMTETQMDSIKGGTTWPDWLVDLVDDVVDNLEDALDHLDDALQNVPLDFDEDYWDQVHEDLHDEGFISSDPPM